MTKTEKEKEPSFPHPDDEHQWDTIRNRRPFEYPRVGGVDCHKDQNYDKSVGGFIGQRLRDGYNMIHMVEDDSSNLFFG